MFIAQIIPLMLIRKQTALCIAQIVRLKLIRKQTAMCIAQIVPQSENKRKKAAYTDNKDKQFKAGTF